MLSFLCITSSFLRNNYCNTSIKKKRLDNSTTTPTANQELFVGSQGWNLTTKVFTTFQNLIMSLQEKFQAALKVIRSLPADGPYQPSNNTKLRFYSLFKQATDGTCNQPRPGFWDPIGKAKWDAWKSLGDMSSDEAMSVYIEELKKIVETMSFNGDVQDFLDSIGPFYEFISLNSPDLDKLKETVDRLTSSGSNSSGCTTDSAPSSNNNSLPSSPATTPQDTPAKEPNGKIPSIEAATLLSTTTPDTKSSSNIHSNSNGHIPNQKSTTTAVTTSSKSTLEISDDSKIIPPPSPMHKPHVNGHAKIYSMEELDNEEEDETLEIENEAATDSDEYYSGDSDLDPEEADMTLMKSGIPTIITTASSPTKTDSLILHNNNNNVNINNKNNTNVSNNKEHTSDTVTVRKHRTKQHSSSSSSNVERKLRGSREEEGNNNNRVAVSETVKILQGTVDRLNRDIDHITARLRILEAAYALKNGNNNQTTSTATVSNSNKNVRRPFRELSNSTYFLIFTWPFAVHFLLKLISWYIERRRRRQVRPLLALKL